MASHLCPRLLVSAQLCLDTPAAPCSFLHARRRLGSLLGFNYRFPEGLSAHHRAAAGCRWEGGGSMRGCTAASRHGACTHAPGLLCIFLSKTWLVPILEDERASGKKLATGERMKERGSRSRGGGQNAPLFPWRWWLLPPGSALHPLNNDLVIPFILSKPAWCSDSSSPGGGSCSATMLESKKVHGLGSATTQQANHCVHSPTHSRHC